MALLIGAALGVLSIAIVVYPFLKSRFGARAEGSDNSATPGTPELESIYEAVRTLQLEHRLGKVPDGIFREQLRGYRLQAAAVLRRQAQGGAGEAAAAERLLEQEILAARGRLSSSNGGSARCHQCGAAVGLEASDCPSCNAKLAVSGSDAP